LAVVFVVAACVLSLALRLPFLSVPLTGDEAGYAYVASWLGRGPALYRDLWFDRPQGIFLLYGAILALFGESGEAIRLAAGLYNVFTVVLIFVAGSHLSGTRAGVVAAFLFAISSASPGIEGFTANGELFMNLPTLAAVLLALHYRWFAAGCLLAIATLVKPTALLALIAALIAVAAIDRDRSTTRALHALVRTAAGAALVTIPFVVHGMLSGPDDFWYAIVGFRAEEHSAFAAGTRFFDELRQSGPHVTWAVLPVWFLVALWLRRGRWRSPHGVVLLSFLGGTIAGAALGGYWYWHYFVGILPPAALIAGEALVLDLLPGVAGAMRRRAAVIRAHLRRPRLPEPAPLLHLARPRLNLPWATAGLLAAAISVVANTSFVGATPDETGLRLYRRHASPATRDIARYLEARTHPDDTVYAAFAGPEVYFSSRRRSASRYLYWTEINRVPGALDAVIATLDDPRRCPKYIVRLQGELEQPGRAAPFWERVEQRFYPEIIISGVILYRRLND